jgi:cell division protein ZapE
VLVALERLETDLAKRGLFGRPPEVRGVYLWGPPGRGKSMLMDLFYSATPEPRKDAPISTPSWPASTTW